MIKDKSNKSGRSKAIQNSISLIVLVLFFVIFMACTKTAEDKKSKTNKLVKKTIKIKKKPIVSMTKEKQANNLDKSIDKYKKSIALEPNNASSHYSLGITYAKKGNNSLAAEHFYKAGLIFLEKGKRKNALKAYEELKKIKSKDLEQTLYKKLHPR